MLQFKEDRLESTCKTTSAPATTTYRYAVVRPQVYAATMTGSSFRTEMVGSTREYQYQVDSAQLRTVSAPAPMPPTSAAATPTATPPRVETEATRMPCP